MGQSSTNENYATKLDLAEAASVVTEPGFLFGAAEKDTNELGKLSVDAYLEEIELNAARFFRKKQLHDRVPEMALLDKRLMRDEGSLGIMLGGKSFGKTFMVKALKQRIAANEKAFNEEQERLRKKAFDLRNDASMQQALADDPNTSLPEREQAEDKARELRAEADTLENNKTSRANELMPRRLVIYDARRKGSDITKGIIASLIDQAPATFTSMSAFLPALAGTATAVAGSLMRGAELNALSKAAEAAEAVSKAIGNASALEAVLDAYVRTCAKEGVFPCLALDELNMALPSGTEEEKARTLKTLQLLVQYSKQEEQMNVLLSASEQTEPFRLSALGFKSSHFSYTMLVSDVPPAAMRALLMKEWGMGQHLADAMMAVWGGKIVFCGHVSMLV